MNPFHLFSRPGRIARPTGPERPLSGAVEALSREHGALLRQIGGLQHRVSAELQTGARVQRQLEIENLRLRAELVILRTAVAWDLGRVALSRSAQPRIPPAQAPRDPALGDAHRVICQTGCVGHAHPWLDAAGQCARSGQACDRVDTEGPLAVASNRAVHPVVVDGQRR